MKKREEQPPPYLIEQVAGNSYSSWCPKRMPARSFVRFFLCLVMLMAFSVEKALAIGEVNWDNSWIEQRFDPEKATLTLDVRVYQDWGGYNGTFSCGFMESGYLEINVAGYFIRIQGHNGWRSLDKNSTQVTGIDYKYVDWLGLKDVGGGKKSYYLRINVPLTQDRIGQDIQVEYDGRWQRNANTVIDNTFKFSISVDTRVGCTTTSVTKAYYGDKDRKPGYFIEWKKDGKADKNSIDRLGDFILCDSNGNAIEGVASQRATNESGKFFIPSDKLSLDDSQEYKIKQEYKPSYNKAVVFQTFSRVKVRPAYPQLKEIEAKYDVVTRKVKVNWFISNAPTLNCVEDDMLLTVNSKDNETNIPQP